jgi:Bacterial Ig domain
MKLTQILHSLGSARRSRKASRRWFVPLLEPLEKRLPLALFIENFSDDFYPIPDGTPFDRTRAAFDSWDADPLTVPGGDTDADPNTTVGPDELLIPHSIGANVRLDTNRFFNATHHLTMGPGGQYFINFYGNRLQPGGIGPDAEVAAVGFRYNGAGRVIVEGANGIKTLEANEFFWSHGSVTANDPNDGGQEMGPILNVRFIANFNADFFSVDDISVLVLEAGFSNNAPVAVDDSVVVRAGVPQDIFVLSNDLDLDGDELTPSNPSGALHGLPEVQRPRNAPSYIRYTPDNGFIGQDSFTYIAFDGRGGSDMATVFISVAGPTAVDDRTSARPGVPTVIDVLANDTQPVSVHPLTIVDVPSLTAHGSVSVHEGLITYTSDLEFLGADTFTYTILDPLGSRSTATVHVTVNARPNPSGGRIVAAHGAPSPLVDEFAFTDRDGDAVTVSLVPGYGPTHGAVFLEVVGDRVRVEYHAFAGRVIGPDVFVYRLFDGHGYSEAIVEIRVPNHAPMAIPDLVLTHPWLEDRVRVSWVKSSSDDPQVERGDFATIFAPDPLLYPFLHVLVSDNSRGAIDDLDLDGDRLTYRIVEYPSLGRLLDFEELTGRFAYDSPLLFPQRDGATGAILPNEPWIEWGYDEFTYEVTDGRSSSQAVVTILSTPSSETDNYVLSTRSGTTISTNLERFFPPNTPAVVLGPDSGHLERFGSQSIIYRPDPGFVGADHVRFVKVFESTIHPTHMVPGNLTFLVLASPPELHADVYQVERDSSLVVLATEGVLANDLHPDGFPLQVDSFTDPPHGELLNAGYSGSFTYLPDAGYFGPDSFTYQASDGQGNIAQMTVTVNVTSNRRPWLSPGLDFLDVQNFPVPFTPPPLVGTIDWFDRDGDAVTPLIVPGHGPQHGRAALRVVGHELRVEYYPQEGHFAPQDEFRVAVTDGQLQSEYAVVRVSREENTAPTARDDFFVLQNRPVGIADTDPVLFAFPGVTWNDQDPDGDFLMTSLVTGPAHGTLTLERDGRFIYRPERDFVGTDTFVYSVTDGSEAGGTATVTLRVVDEQVPTVFDDTVHRTWPADLVPADFTSGQFANYLPPGRLVVDNDIRPPDWQDPPFFPSSSDWELQLVARPRQEAQSDYLTISEGKITLHDYGWAEFNPVRRDGNLEYYFASVTGDVEATYAFRDLRHSGYLSNFARIRWVISPPAQGTNLTRLVPRVGVGSIDVQASPGTMLERADLVTPPAPPPPGLGLLYDRMFNLVINGMSPGGGATVTLTYPHPLPSDVTYLKYGRRDDNPFTFDDESQPQWYEFRYDPATGTGAEFVGNQIILHFVDGLRGDGDRLANGVILDPGGPAFTPPIATADAYVVDEDHLLGPPAPGVLANDTNLTGNPLAAILVTDVVHGTLDLQSDGSFSYEPDADFYGTDSFTYKATTSGLESAIAVVTITINPVNDPPVASAAGPPGGLRGKTLTFTVGATDVEPEDQTAGFSYHIDWNGDGTVDQVVHGPSGTQVDHIFTQAGSFAVRISAADQQGAYSDAVAHSILIIDPPPTVQSVTINDGHAQRSMITSLTVMFDQLVMADPGAFEVRKIGAKKPVVLNVAWSEVAGQSVARLTFNDGRDVQFSSLVNGTYRLTIRGDKIRDASGRLLDGDGDGLAGGNHVDEFFRRFGDTDGDGDVDRLDKDVFSTAYGKRRDQPGYLWYLDFNNNGRVWKEDLALFLLGYCGKYRR